MYLIQLWKKCQQRESFTKTAVEVAILRFKRLWFFFFLFVFFFWRGGNFIRFWGLRFTWPLLLKVCKQMQERSITFCLEFLGPRWLDKYWIQVLLMSSSVAVENRGFFLIATETKRKGVRKWASVGAMITAKKWATTYSRDIPETWYLAVLWA